MNNKNNEQGYAMILVLLLIVFITIISAVFLRSSISNAKQEQIVDKNNLAVVSAEMGVEFYETAISNEYYKRQVELDNLVKKMIAETKKDKLVNYEGIRTEVAKKLKAYFEARKLELSNFELLEKNTENPLFITPEYEFSLKDWQIKTDEKSGIIKISGLVEGKKTKTIDGEKGFKKELAYEQVFVVPSFDSALTDETGNNEMLLSWPQPDITLENFFNEGIPTQSCEKKEKIEKQKNKCKTATDNNIKKVKESGVYANADFIGKDKVEIEESSAVYITGNMEAKKEFEVEKGSKLYVGKDLHVKNENKKDDDDGEFEIEEKSEVFVRENAFINGEVEIEKHSSLYVRKDLTVKDELEVEEYSKLYVGGNLQVDSRGKKDNDGEFEIEKHSIVHVDGNADIKGELEIEDFSTLYVGGTLSVTDDVEVEDDSKLTVLGNFEVKGNLDVEDRSKVCVQGNLSVEKKIKIDSKSNIYVFGVVNYGNINKVDRLVIVPTLEEFSSFCGANAKKETWGPPKIDVKY